ncbi:endolytic transglycosylase MltG [Gordonia sp. HS-NH1]|uniref:endolytic transglycosylase MltG n=1 Tax=Gordonia sp. HS-NH1 TaxID=1435068 RepID=UPI0006E2586F|nr:endolytic transglycosylase MltG [Gordonia sp. HS-NH1]
MHDGESGEPPVTDDRRRTRHRDGQGRRTEGMDPERLRYFTQPAAGSPHTRHRRRRTGPESGDSAGRRPAPPPVPPAEQARPVTGTPGPRATPVRIPPGQAPTPPPAPPRPAPPQRPRVEDDVDTDFTMARPATPEPPVRGARNEGFRSAPAGYESAGKEQDDYADPGYGNENYRDEHHGDEHYPEESYAEESYGDPRQDRPADTARTVRDPGPVTPAPVREAEEHDDWWAGVDDAEAAQQTRRAPRRKRSRGKRRAVLAIAIVFMLALITGVGYYGVRATGLLESRKDYTNAAGAGDVVVDIPDNSTLADFGRILVDADVVGSVRAFVDAAGGQPISGGLYKMRTQIPATTAVEMLTDDGAEHRVGRVVIPPGLQLDSKTGIDGKVTPGIFQLIENATSFSVNGQQEGVTVADLEKAAAEATPEELGVPEWARQNVAGMTGDHRRIEGLIAPTTWERVEPDHTATQILQEMISQSGSMFEQWGLLDRNNSGLEPYETLIAASIVEREVRHVEDAPKVARVIRNRLDRDQLLQMDSTQNYTADITNIDVHGEAYKNDNEWNTYRYKGLPPTPIAAVGVPALEAMLDPAPGGWLYFVTVDTAGTTLFANTFEDHKRNREVACRNKLVATGCSQ